ncbi:MAG: T9SS type A sorting domain-containing protein, partial [Deinococcales bacterium]|nr:T9SS type A sorting domain-containing protein [Chitinophagaceae bacterium]
TNSYINVSNTTTSLISNTAGYYLFVRGDRGVPLEGAAAPTILRIKGDVITGTQVVAVPAGKFVTFGNPYPSNLNLRTAAKSNISNSYYAWNPNSAGSYNVGAFENYTFDGTNYLQVPGGTIRNTIQSGEAIFIQSSGAAGTLTINETDKTGGVTTPVSRTASTLGREGVTKPTLEINMYTKDIDSSTYLADGILMNFNDDYSSGVDNDDVRKILNAGDNIFLKNGNANLIVERRPTLKVSDTIKLNLTNTRINSYRFELDPSALSNINLEATLKDKFIGSETSVSLLHVTNYNFNITSDAASKVADRFMIVFKQVKPMQFVKINAVRNKNNTATVTWYTENENNINTYSIEHSKDGISFIEIGKQMPTANNNGNPYYSFVDATADDGNNWYRTKAYTINGTSQLSEIAKINATEILLPATITVYPNPVQEGQVQLSFIYEKLGKYQITIVNMAGQTVYSEILKLETNNFKKIISLGNAAAGNYQLSLINEEGTLKKLSFLVK